MNSFALHLEKIAQAGTMMRPSPAQLYAAEKAEKDFSSLMKADSPKAYSAAIAGGILSGLGLPTALGVTSFLARDGGLAEATGRKIGSTYMQEALTRLYGFNPKEAGLIASSITSSNPNITANVNARIRDARLNLAHMLSDTPMTGIVDESARKNILSRTEKFLDRAVVQAGRPADQVRYFKSRPVKEKLVGMFNTPGFREIADMSPEFKRTAIPGFTRDEAKALMGIGEHLYTQRTGKALNDTGVAVKLVARQVGNSLKAGIPLALILGGMAGIRQRSKAKEKNRLTQPTASLAFGGVS